ncbi:MAG: hypothetical protein IV100_22825 [Myxococcales bacterium]|nr:hypothetical protein [Myxococcales bacterium]
MTSRKRVDWAHAVTANVAVGLLAFGCGSDVLPQSPGDVVSDASAVDTRSPDVVAMDGGDLGLEGDPGVENDIPTHAEHDVPKARCDFPADVWCPCTKDWDCEYGDCIYGATTKLCMDDALDCPDGFVTVVKLVAGVDVTYVCQSTIVHLCQPCVNDADCDRDGLCLDFGDEGHFCGTDCGTGRPECPEGYGCVDDQCRPTSGQCACNPFGADFGLTTECASTSPAGQCKGTRQCSVEGLSACTAAVPVVETCRKVPNPRETGGARNC